MSDYNSVPMKPDGEMRLVKPEEYDRLQRSRDAWQWLAKVRGQAIARLHCTSEYDERILQSIKREEAAAMQRLAALGETVEEPKPQEPGNE